MEKFLIPKNRIVFVNWLLNLSINNNWAIVVEHSDKDTYNYLKNKATITSLPITARHEYDSLCKLTAFSNAIVTDDFVNMLMAKSHVLSIYDQNKMVFLIADDYHEECFSCSANFYNIYYEILRDEGLIDLDWKSLWSSL